MATRTAVRRTQTRTRPTTRFGRLPAPVGGWNAKDPIAEIPPTDAIVLDNFVPRPGYVENRKGSAAWVSGLPGRVESLLPYRGNGPNADKLFAVSLGGLYDVTNTGNSVANQSGLSYWMGMALGSTPDNVAPAAMASNQWQSFSFATNGTAYTLAFSGADTPIYYNGTKWQTLSINGSSGSITLDPTKLIDGVPMNGRVFLIEKNTLRVWYLAASAIQGTASLLDLGTIADRGGSVIDVGVWTYVSALGTMTLMFVALTDQGQVIIYSGLDPTSSSTWSLVAVAQVGLPIGGPRAMMKYGAELMIMTQDGVLPVSQIIRLDRSQDLNVALTQKIQNAWRSTDSYIGNLGWQALLYPHGQLAIFNVPIAQWSTSYQYVMNVQTGAWARFTGINAFCWEVMNNNIFWGGAGVVYQWESGGADVGGAAITCTLQSAFTDFGDSGALKRFSMVRPLIKTTVTTFPAIDVLADYKLMTPFANQTPVSGPSSSNWGSGLWGSALWADSNGVIVSWTGATGLGYVGAVTMQQVIQPTAVNGIYQTVTLDILGFDVQYQPGGFM